MDLFAHWREQAMLSTMQKLASENAKLRREVRIKTIVYWTCLITGLLLGLAKLYGGL